MRRANTNVKLVTIGIRHATTYVTLMTTIQSAYKHATRQTFKHNVSWLLDAYMFLIYLVPPWFVVSPGFTGDIFKQAQTLLLVFQNIARNNNSSSNINSWTQIRPPTYFAKHSRIPDL